MLALIYNNSGKLELVEKPRPHAKNNTAVIQVNASSICGTDFRTYMHGSKKIAAGTTVGHEMCGEIVEIGKDITGFKVGDRVTVAPALGCGKCYMCKKGHTNMCDNLKTLGFQFDGSFAEYMEIPAEFFDMGSVNLVQSNVSCLQAALAEPVACAVNAQELLAIEHGDYVAVFGSGFIGTNHAELAFAAGAEKVILIEPNAERLAIAKEYVPGINTISGSEDAVARVMELTGGRGVDVAIVACSVGAAQKQAQEILAKRGRISLFGGLPGEGTGFIDSNIIHYKEAGVFGAHASTAAQNKKVLDWLAHGKIETAKYISKTYSLKDALQAFEDIEKKGIMKAVIVADDREVQ